METVHGPVIGHIQTDTFCDGCGYNLNTQSVTKDERLGILICRCPECGEFAAAGKATTARQPWLNRFGIALLIVWILFLIWVFGMLSMFSGFIAYGHASEAVEFANIAPTTMPTTMPVFPVGGYYYIRRAPPATDEEIQRRDTEVFMVCAGCILLGMLAGGAVAVCMWHTRGFRRLTAFLPAVVGVGFAYLTWVDDPMMRGVRNVALRRMGLCFGLLCFGVAIGLWLGRPIARFALGIMIPPKVRQHLAFLWTTDGKQLKV